MENEKKETKRRYFNWICRKCGHEVIASEVQPSPIRWTDGHVCYFSLNEEVKQ